jgi:hypothetical protein
MLQMRARWFAMRDAFPDALRGISSAEESEDMAVVAPRVYVATATQATGETDKPALETAYDDASAIVVRAFESIGVSRDMLARKLGHAPTQLEPQEVEQLRATYAEVQKNPKRKADLFGQPSSAAGDINAKFGAQASEVQS